VQRRHVSNGHTPFQSTAAMDDDDATDEEPEGESVVLASGRQHANPNPNPRQHQPPAPQRQRWDEEEGEEEEEEETLDFGAREPPPSVSTQVSTGQGFFVSARDVGAHSAPRGS
jgi:hypothetical protein